MENGWQTIYVRSWEQEKERERERKKELLRNLGQCKLKEMSWWEELLSNVHLCTSVCIPQREDDDVLWMSGECGRCAARECESTRGGIVSENAAVGITMVMRSVNKRSGQRVLMKVLMYQQQKKEWKRKKNERMKERKKEKKRKRERGRKEEKEKEKNNCKCNWPIFWFLHKSSKNAQHYMNVV